MLELKSISEVVEVLPIFEDCLLFEVVCDEAIHLGCHFNLFAQSIENLALDRVHDGLNLHDLVLPLVDFEGCVEVEA